MDKELFNRYIANRCSEKEVEEVFRTLLNRKDESKKQSALLHFWNAIQEENTIEEKIDSRQLDRIHHTINLNQAKKGEGKKLSFAKNHRQIYAWFYRAAAILIIPLLLFSVYSIFNFYNKPVVQASNYEVVAPVGARFHFPLPDGSMVWLNQGSKLVYPNRFVGGSRTVELEGEAYFEVSHNEKIPFIVEAGGMAVKAVGTSFNVKSYDGSDFETALESGKVIMLDGKRKGDFEEICEMKPGERFVYNATTHKYQVKAEDLLKYVSWREGKLVFQDDQMDQVIERLGKWYNVKISLQEKELESLHYTGTFEDETLDQVLDLLERITPINYTVVDRQHLGDGRYTKKEILIYKKRR